MKAGRKKGEFFYRLYQSTEIYNLTRDSTPEYIKTPECRLFWLICGLLEDLEVLTAKDIVILNRAINGYTEASTRTAIHNLKLSGLIATKRESKQYFVKAYISITEEGNLLKAMIREKINYNPLTILEKAHKEEAKRKKASAKKAGKTRKETFKRMRAEGIPINQNPIKNKMQP